jgi:hypothetical protein
VLLVCNGHYSKPWLPKFYSKYKKNWLHSNNYRNPRAYKDKTVAIIGAAYSGLDILPQVAAVATKVYLLHDNVGKYSSLISPNVIEMHRPIDATSESLILSDGIYLTGIDSVIYCTGYSYDFPFFDPSESRIKILHNGKIVSPLFEHTAHAKYFGSLFFIGINHVASTFPMSEYQVRFALAIISGHATGFSREDVLQWEENRYR